jgi:5-methyltetrahydrofolate--homocysteine methyltransferase
MTIHFDPSRWDDIRKTYALWWNRKLDRPLMNVKITDAYEPEGPEPGAPLLSQENCTDLSISPEDIIDGIDYHLRRMEFLGDSYPYFNFDVFGPGILSAFCGARIDNSTGRVWFFADTQKPIEETFVAYDRENKWVRRIKDIYAAGMEKWKGQVLLGIPDLGGLLDVAAIFRTTEGLLTDLVDSPGEVIRLCAEIQIAWHEAYRDLNSVLQPVNPGYSDWSLLYSETPAYILQSDFSCMISPAMFGEFTLPFLKKDCGMLNHSIYHLDGTGQIPHLDSLLSLEDLDAVQWIYGDGKPTARHWIDLYKRIEAANKGIHVVGDMDDFLAVYSAVKKNLYYIGYFTRKDREKAENLIASGRQQLCV